MVLTNGCDLCICVWNERYKKEGGIQRTEDGVMISTFILYVRVDKVQKNKKLFIYTYSCYRTYKCVHIQLKYYTRILRKLLLLHCNIVPS